MMSKWRWAGPPRSPQGCPPLTPKPFTRLPLSAGVSRDSGDPGPLLQGSSQARLLTWLSSQVALGFRPHTFGDRKNTLDRKKGALPWWISLTHCPCCQLSIVAWDPEFPRLHGDFGRSPSPYTEVQGRQAREHLSEATGLLSFLFDANSPSPSHLPTCLWKTHVTLCLLTRILPLPQPEQPGHWLCYLLALGLGCTSCLLHTSAPSSAKQRCVSTLTSQGVS